MRNPLQSLAKSLPARTGGQGWLFAGTFLIAFSLLAFEISTVRTINFTVGPSFIYFAIALAMLGLSAAGSILSLVDLRRLEAHRTGILFWSSLAIVALLLTTHFVAADAKGHLNAVLEQAGRSRGLQGVVETLVVQSFTSALQIGLLLSLPYFLFGGLLAFLFATTPGAVYGRLYGADLIGAAAGCLGAIVVMETTGYAFSVTFPAVVAGLAAAAFAAATNIRLALGGVAVAVLLCLLPLSDRFAAAIEPPADPNYLIRDYGYESRVAELWHGWNSFTRVGAIGLMNEDGQAEYAIMSLSNGDGMAWLLPFRPDRPQPTRHAATLSTLLLGPPREALVMFAGVGADLMTLYENAPDRTRATGIELNRTLVEGARELSEFGAAEFLAQEPVNLEISEGRVFLERDQGLYDTILYSWSGATAAYYAGALGGTTQFLFTYQGLSAALDRLKPGGYAVLLQVNKVNMLATLRRYLAEQGVVDPLRTAIVLFSPDTKTNAWDGTFDDNPLLIKPTGWTDAEIDQVLANAGRFGWEVAYAPGRPVHSNYQVYERVLGARDVSATIAELNAETGLRFGVITDNRPFYLDLFATENYWDAEFWGRFQEGSIRNHEAAQIIRVLFVTAVSIVAFAFILLPLAFRKRLSSNARTASHLTYFFCLGSGFMALEIVLMQKASLLFGNPGLTIAVVLASVILLSGIGSLVSGWTFGRGLSFRGSAAAIVVYVLALYVGLDPMLYAMLGWPMVLKGLGLAAIIAPGAVLLGHLFPQGLSLAGRDDAGLIPWAWGINGAMSTVAAGLTPLLAQAWGFNAMLLVVAGLYAVILLLPAYANRQSRPSLRTGDALAAAE